MVCKQVTRMDIKVEGKTYEFKFNAKLDGDQVKQIKDVVKAMDDAAPFAELYTSSTFLNSINNRKTAAEVALGLANGFEGMTKDKDYPSDHYAWAAVFCLMDGAKLAENVAPERAKTLHLMAAERLEKWGARDFDGFKFAIEEYKAGGNDGKVQYLTKVVQERIYALLQEGKYAAQIAKERA